MHWGEFQAGFVEKLSPRYGAGEAEALFYHYLLARKNWGRLQFFNARTEALSGEEEALFLGELQQLASGIPLQHLTGLVEFYGLRLRVTPDVLIPRPETEEWLNALVNNYLQEPPLAVVDWCTGSGCLALAAATLFPKARVTGLDISPEALNVARENAARNNLEVNFLRADLANPASHPTLPNALVLCNPPYVTPEEKDEMEPHVLDHEPHLALFAPAGDPLFFYRHVLDWAAENRATAVALEINPRYAEAGVELLKHHLFKNIVIHTDLQGRERALFAQL